MEKIYTMADVNKYISGKYIPDDLVEQYENDPNFMIKVIEKTMDKNTYFCCSNKIKYNPDVISKMLELFNNDYDFCYKLVKEFEKHNSDPTELIDLKIKLSNTYRFNDDLPLKVIRKEIDKFYREERENQLYTIECEPKKKYRDEYEMGFIFVIDEYKNKSNISDLFASRMIEEIYEKEIDSNFEMYLHNKYFDKSDLIELGLDKEVLITIDKYDSNLARYLVGHRYLLENRMSSMYSIINNWDHYRVCDNEEVLNLIHDFSELQEPTLNELQLARYVEDKYSINKLVFDYCYGDDELIKKSNYDFSKASIKEKEELRKLDTKLKDYFSGKKTVINNKVLEYKINNN